MKPLEVGEYLVADPRVCFGKLTFKGTRVPVQTVLTFLAMGETIEEVLRGWPRVTRDGVEEAIRLAAVAWPELMRPEDAEALQLWAATLAERRATETSPKQERDQEDSSFLIEISPYLVVDLARPSRKLTFKGTRVPVRPILYFLSRERSFKQILADWPQLKLPAVADAIQRAAAALEERYAVTAEPGQVSCSRELGRHLVVHPGIGQGRVIFQATRLPVEKVLLALAKGRTLKQMLAHWPDLSEEAIAEAIQLAAATLEEQALARSEAIDEPARPGRTA
jgi:uncharacterized protein (DUF433 family)